MQKQVAAQHQLAIDAGYALTSFFTEQNYVFIVIEK